MLKDVLVFPLALIITFSTAQPIKTIFKTDSLKLKHFSFFGEMFVQGTQLKNTFTGVYGGKAGFIFNRTIAFGGVGEAFLMSSYFKGDNFYSGLYENLDLRLSAGGFFFQYIHRMDKPIHFSVPVNFLIGQATEFDKTGKYIESSRAFIIEPGITMEFNFTKILIIGVSASYRISQISKLTNINSSDIGGFAFGLTGRFGRF